MHIKKLILETNDTEILRIFYEGVLGVDVIEREPDFFSFEIGKTSLVFRKNIDLWKPFYHFAINIPSNKISEAEGWLSDKVELIWIEDYASYVADFVNWNAKSVYFFDPAGNILELIARFDLDNPSTEPFSSSQFLSVSEAGIVFPEKELEQRTQELIDRYQLSFFKRQPPSPQFKALGNDEGLFIIVPDNRAWYPTRDSLSQIFPMGVEFENNGKEAILSL